MTQPPVEGKQELPPHLDVNLAKELRPFASAAGEKQSFRALRLPINEVAQFTGYLSFQEHEELILQARAEAESLLTEERRKAAALVEESERIARLGDDHVRGEALAEEIREALADYRKEGGK